jgi:hypothetical protein
MNRIEGEAGKLNIREPGLTPFIFAVTIRAVRGCSASSAAIGSAPTARISGQELYLLAPARQGHTRPSPTKSLVSDYVVALAIMSKGPIKLSCLVIYGARLQCALVYASHGQYFGEIPSRKDLIRRLKILITQCRF